MNPMEWDEQSLNEQVTRHEIWLMDTPGVEGTGIGLDRSGQLCLKIYLTQKNAELEQQIRRKVGEVPVDFEITGGIEAQ